MTQPHTDIVVIGAGLAGMTVAHALASDGADVLVLDAKPDVAAGASHGNAGLVTPSMSGPWNGPGITRQILSAFLPGPSAIRINPITALLSAKWGMQTLRHSSASAHAYATLQNFRLARYSQQEMHRLATGLGLQFDQSKTATLKLFKDQKSLDHELEIAVRLSSEGIAWRQLKGHDVPDVEPTLARYSPKLKGAILYPDDEVGDARKFVEALSQDFTRKGGRIDLSAKVDAVRTHAGQVSGVQTGDKTISCKTVILATGASTAKLARPLGLRLPIQPVKGYSVTYDGQGAELPRQTLIDDSLHIAITVLGNRLRLAGIAELTGHDLTIDRKKINAIEQSLKELLPDTFAGLDPESAVQWAGHRPVSADGLPYIGATSMPGLFVNTGHGHLGWTLACGSARLLVDIIQSSVPAIDPAAYDPRRFS